MSQLTSFLLQTTIPAAVYWLWAVVLVIAVVVILPIVVILLHRTMRAARQIEQYFAEMADAGAGIAQNTSHIKALSDTISVASTLLSVAGNINSHSATIQQTLAQRVGRRNGKDH